MIIGVGFYSITLGSITTLIMDLDKETAILNKTLADLEDIVTKCDVPS